MNALDLSSRFPSNNSESAKEKEPEHRVKKIINGEVKEKKPGFIKSFVNAIVPSDIEGTKKTITDEVIIPSIIDTIERTLIDSIQYWFSGGEQYGYYRRPGSSLPGRLYDYSTKSVSKLRSMKYGVVSPPSSFSPPESSEAKTLSYDNIVVPTKKDAEEVIQQLRDLISGPYKVARVLDLYDFVGVTGMTPEDNNNGWIDLSMATYTKVPGGWLLILPKAMPIDDDI